MDLREISKNDPVKRNVAHTLNKEQMDKILSPMDPPEGFAPPSMETLTDEELHPFLRGLRDEHKSFLKALDQFEDAVLKVREGTDPEAHRSFRGFFETFDTEIIKHNQVEEKQFFSIIHRRLIEKGEHSQGANPTTAINLLEDEHRKALQQTAVIFNLFALAMRLPDEKSRLVTMDVALEQAKDLIELLKLHIFREDHILFPLAQKHLTPSELTLIQETV